MHHAINVACYNAAALLPNGENAHVTVRAPSWWLITHLCLCRAILSFSFCVRPKNLD